MKHHAIVTPDIHKESLPLHGSHKIVSVTISDDKQSVIIVRQYPSKANQASGKPFPDYVYKEIYTIENGKLIHKETIEGTHTPAHYVQETICFSK